MVKNIISILIVAVITGSCNQVDFKGLIMPTGDGVEKRFEQSRQMNPDLHAGAVEVDRTYLLYVCADPHINRTSVNLNYFNDALRNDGKASFGIILGDCTEVRHNFQAYMNALAYDPDKHLYDYDLYHLAGNHDLYFNGWEEYKEIVGPSVYWFEAVFPGGKDLYIGLDTASGTLGRKQAGWLRSLISEYRHEYRHAIILTHTNFFYTDNSQSGSGNMPVEEVYSLIDFFGKHDISLVLQGHDHYREDLTYDDVRYLVLGTIRDESEYPEYLKIEVSSDGISLDWQSLPDNL